MGLGSDKSPGPDGFPIFFYQKFWDVVRLDFIRIMDGLHAGTLQLDGLNYATMVLIPKKDELKEVGDFRPISVLNASVKITTKVLANRLGRYWEI